MKSASELIAIGQYQVEVNRRRGFRGMNLAVKADGRIRVRCNVRRARPEIEDFVFSCADFIARRREQIRELEQKHPLRSFVSGESLLWMGAPVTLDVVWSWNKKIKIGRTESGFEMLAPVVTTPAERLKALEKFYRGEARCWLEARVEFWRRVMGFGPRSLTIRGQRTLWGSCTSEGAVSLNWKLMSCPPEVIDYVVVHELCHLKEQNHSARYWALVSSFIPNYRELRKWLKDHQQQITRQFLVVGQNS
jgi:predicted metal-dependent hydrolase